MSLEPDDVAGRLLVAYRRLAVVGCSGTPGKDAHDVPLFMRRLGYEVLPVNPRLDSWEGGPAWRALADVPRPEVVNVFRPSEEAAGVARQAVAAGAKAVWLQLGIRSPEARRVAEAAGLLYVEDRCIMVEWRRLERAGRVRRP